MARYLLTHSLLSSWLYTMKEDTDAERDHLEEFLAALRREKQEPTEAMKNGVRFENLVTAITWGADDSEDRWHGAASKIAAVIDGGSLQHKASKEIEVGGLALLLYGRLDALKAGEIYDIKFSKGYERGKYLDSTQHPVYLELVPEALGFTYLISNGSEVWTERYRRDETPSIYPVISDFLDWLRDMGLMDTYKEKWLVKGE